MTGDTTANLDARLLDDWQRGLAIVERPFDVMANACAVSEKLVIARLKAMQDSGVIARVGAVVRPNTIAASTLAAVSVPDLDVDRVAEIMVAEPGINHVYLRENEWNIWFVATGPDRGFVDAALERVAARSSGKVLDLRLERSYHIDLGFALNDAPAERHADPARRKHFAAIEPRDDDAALVQHLTQGLPLVPTPFAQLARTLGRTQSDVLQRVRALADAGVLPRIGLIVRHRALGWRSNAMVAWDVPEGNIDAIGERLAATRGVNLCYRRRRYAHEWPYNLYCMIHAKSRGDALATLAEASAAAGLDPCPRQILFSSRCYKQTGAMVAAPAAREAA